MNNQLNKRKFNAAGDCINYGDAGYDRMEELDHVKKDGIGCGVFLLIAFAVIAITVVGIYLEFLNKPR